MNGAMGGSAMCAGGEAASQYCFWATRVGSGVGAGGPGVAVAAAVGAGVGGGVGTSVGARLGATAVGGIGVGGTGVGGTAVGGMVALTTTGVGATSGVVGASGAAAA
jgi:hypothetical protein